MVKETNTYGQIVCLHHLFAQNELKKKHNEIAHKNIGQYCSPPANVVAIAAKPTAAAERKNRSINDKRRSLLVSLFISLTTPLEVISS